MDVYKNVYFIILSSSLYIDGNIVVMDIPNK